MIRAIPYLSHLTSSSPSHTKSWDDSDDSDDDDDDDDGHYSTPLHGAGRKGRSDKVFTEKWHAFLTKASDSEVFSPLVEEIVSKIQYIRKKRPRTKVLVVSEFVFFLDIIKQGIQRRGKTDSSLNILIDEYNGNVELYKRSQVSRTFNHENTGPRLLLLSAGAGGVGLNLAQATHIIISEPLWTSGLREQVIGRAYRPPQSNTIHVGDVEANPSAIDKYIKDSVAGKVQFRDQLMPLISREDGEAFEVGELPTQDSFRDGQDTSLEQNHHSNDGVADGEADSLGSASN